MRPSPNCFDELRLALAGIVLFAHAGELSGASSLAWMAEIFNSDFAVKGFFAISGYLVSRSFLSSDGMRDYFAKRLRRICPAYVFVILYCLLVGFIASDLGTIAFFASPETLKYLAANLAFLNFLQPTLPGAFDVNPVNAMNGALWTIKIELMLYCVVPALFLLYQRIGHLGGLLAALCLGLAWYGYFTFGFDHPAASAIARQFPGQLPYFAIGSFLAVADIGRRTLFAALAFSAVYLLLNIPSPASDLLNMLAYPVLVIGLSQVRFLSLGIGRLGDLSYGVYLFHFPTLQLVTHLGLFRADPYLGLAVSVLVTLGMALMSWQLVEKRVLRRSSHYRLAASGAGPISQS